MGKYSSSSKMGSEGGRSTNYGGIERKMGNTCAAGGRKPATGDVCKKSKVGNRRTKVPADRYR